MLIYILIVVIIILILGITYYVNSIDPEQQLLDNKQAYADEIKRCNDEKDVCLLQQATLKIEVNDKNKIISTMVEEKNAAMKELDSINTTIKQLQVDVDDKNTRVEIQELNGNLEELSSNIANLDAAIKLALKKRDSNLKIISENQVIINNLEAKINTLTANIVDLDAEIVKLTGKNAQLTITNTELSNNIVGLKTNNSTLLDEQNKLKGQISELEIQRDSLNNKLLEYADSTEADTIKISELEKQITEVTNEIKVLTSSLRDLDFIIMDMGCKSSAPTTQMDTPVKCWQQCKDTLCKFASYNVETKACNTSIEYPSSCTFEKNNMLYIKT